MKSLRAKTTRRRVSRRRAGGTDETGDYLGKVAQPLDIDAAVSSPGVQGWKGAIALGEGFPAAGGEAGLRAVKVSSKVQSSENNFHVELAPIHVLMTGELLKCFSVS